MNHRNLFVIDAESFAVGETPNRGELVHQDNVVVSDVHVDRIEIGVEHLVIHWVLASLLQPKVHDPAQNFEEVLYDIVLCVPVVLDWEIELVSLVLDHGG